jgi:excisionase family DNA binding protein
MAKQKPRRRPTPVAKASNTTAAVTITVDEAAKRLRIGRNQAYNAVKKGELPVIRLGKRLLVPIAALDRMLSGEVA